MRDGFDFVLWSFVPAFLFSCFLRLPLAFVLAAFYDLAQSSNERDVSVAEGSSGKLDAISGRLGASGSGFRGSGLGFKVYI